LSTGYASRVLFLTTFAGASLAAIGLNQILTEKNGSGKAYSNRTAIWLTVILVGVLMGIAVVLVMLSSSTLTDQKMLGQMRVALKNSLLPLAFLGTFWVFTSFLGKRKIWPYLVLLLVAVDLLRFSVKFTPFSPAVMDFPKTPALEFLQAQAGYYRIDKERAELLPSNSWITYKLMSPSGYDPLYSKQYAYFYSTYNGNQPGSYFSRYAELDKYDQPLLDLAGVKYLLTLDRGRIRYYDEKIMASSSDRLIDYRFKKVMEDGMVIVLENQKVLPRVKLYSQSDWQPDYRQALSKLASGYDFYHRVTINNQVIINQSTSDRSFAEIVGYQPNQVDIISQSEGKAILMLTDAYYPGWKAEVNGESSEVLVADGVYRAVVVPPGHSTVKFIYDPLSFKLGAVVSLISLGVIVLLFIKSLKKLKQ
jgi:hypothetical protein